MEQYELIMLMGFGLLSAVILFILTLQSRRIKFLTDQRQQPQWQVFSEWFKEMRSGLDRTTDILQRQLSATNDSVNQRLDNAAQLMRLLNRDLGQIHQVGQQMHEFQNFLRTPKLRGKVGEHILTDILHQILPKSHVTLQHRFRNGHAVDALIKTENGNISVDAKFPLENYLKSTRAEKPEQAKNFRREFFRDVRKHIQAISQKYILPDEHTMDFALMYVPSETIYYEILNSEPLLAHAREKNVLIVSPNTFYYFLRIILLGLQGRQIEERAAFIIKNLQSLKHESNELFNQVGVMNNHLNNAQKAADRVHVRLLTLQQKIDIIAEPGNPTDSERPI